jgi:DNA-binding NarL/FixJ family response regulator
VPDWARDDANLPARAAGRPVRLSDLGLTPRQILVFTLVVQGKPNKVISRELGISESTIKKHVSPVLRTLGVTDRLQAIITLSRRGIALD